MAVNFAACKTTPFGARYLKNPAMFPLGLDGESWGSRELSLGVLDKRFLVCGLSAAQEHTIRSLWPRFVIDDPDRADVALFVHRAPTSIFIKFDRWEYTLDFDYTTKSLSMAGLDLMGRLELVPELRAALWVATEEHDLFHSAFENFLRILVAYAALDLGGGLFHSAAVVEGYSAWLFVGHSGAGKSTVSQLALDSGRAVLSDDLNPVLPNPRGGLDRRREPFSRRRRRPRADAPRVERHLPAGARRKRRRKNDGRSRDARFTHGILALSQPRSSPDRNAVQKPSDPRGACPAARFDFSARWNDLAPPRTERGKII